MTARPHLVVVGGFLGAGKTTLHPRRRPPTRQRGLRCAIILNDQGDSLVDTQLAQRQRFRCRRSHRRLLLLPLLRTHRVAETPRAHSPDVIFAEPVGSCTDISATILQPIQQAYSDVFQLCPLTVLIDPSRIRDNQDIDFLFQKQLEEADLVCYTKSDLYPDPPRASNTRQISARTGQGVAAWLDEVMSGKLSGTILDIDYERYAQAEAALAWLNAEADLACDPPLSPAMLLGPFVDTLDRELTHARIPIVHLKALDQTPEGSLKAALCANGEEPSVEGALDASPSATHHLLLNLRASSAPDPVRAIVQRAIETLPAQLSALRLNCFSPAAPNQNTG